MDWNDRCTFSSLLGKTVTVIKINDDKNRIEITCADETQFCMYHSQDCCESVYVEDVVGDLSDLIGNPLLQAEEATSEDRPHDLPAPDYEPESQTWTFYKLATIKGSVSIRWFGSSNGYYSEGVDFARLN